MIAEPSTLLESLNALCQVMDQGDRHHGICQSFIRLFRHVLVGSSRLLDVVMYFLDRSVVAIGDRLCESEWIRTSNKHTTQENLLKCLSHC